MKKKKSKLNKCIRILLSMGSLRFFVLCSRSLDEAHLAIRILTVFIICSFLCCIQGQELPLYVPRQLDFQ